MSMHEIADKIEQPVKTYCGGIPHYVDTVDSLRKELGECKESSKIIFDAYESLRQQLAECQAREKVLRDALVNENSLRLGYLYRKGFSIPSLANEALALPSDSTALDTMLKHAKRASLSEMAEIISTLNACEEADEIRRMAEELK